MKFLIGLPTTDGKYDVMVIKSLINQLKYITDEHHSVQCSTIKGTMIHNARNAIAQAAWEYDYLFFVDSDCVIQDGTLERLVKHNKDIVSGVYYQKTPPHPPVMYTRNERGLFDCILDYPHDGLIEADGIGMGVCLIKTEVLKKLGNKCFDPYQVEGEPFINAEDLAFCIRAKAAGYKIWVDTGIKAAHQTVSYIGERQFRFAMQEIKEMEKQNGTQHPTTGERRTTGDSTDNQG